MVLRGYYVGDGNDYGGDGYNHGSAEGDGDDDDDDDDDDRVAKTCQPCGPVGAIFSGQC